MSWIGLNDLHAPGRSGHGSGWTCPNALAETGVMAAGTLMIETSFGAKGGMRHDILRYERMAGWQRRLDLMLSADGVLTLEHQQADIVSQARLEVSSPLSEARLRITYGWNAPSRRSVLTIEDMERELLFQAEAPLPLPLPFDDAHEILSAGLHTRTSPETQYLSLSDRIEPVGLSPGFATGVPVETVDGLQKIERLRLGDLVVTAGAGPQPVRWITRRDVPVLGRFRPVRLRAPYFGLSQDILVAPDHRLVITGTEAEYLFGEHAVLVSATDLVDGATVLREPPRQAVQSYYHVLLDGHECLNTAGLWGESLFVGALARMPEVLATTALSEMPLSAVPRHTRFAHPILSAFEAKSLAHALSA